LISAQWSTAAHSSSYDQKEQAASFAQSIWHASGDVIEASTSIVPDHQPQQEKAASFATMRSVSA
jgi:hypothetical protein